MLGALVFLAVVVVLWIFSAPITQWLRSAQSFDVIAFLGEHLFAIAMRGGCLLVLALIWLPKWQAARPELTIKERFEAENEARKTLAQILGGAAVLVGLYFTWANLQVTQETATKDRETTREGQVTERFTRAIDQLGAVNDKGETQLEIRLGGIYALERIARDSERDHWPIMAILTAYVRAHAPWPPKDATLCHDDQSAAATPSAKKEPASPKPAADIQAIVTVLGRRTRTFGNGEDQRLDLTHTDLRGADLQRAHLEQADLRGAYLKGARNLTVE
jgi:Pentapeptide repeats (8 copies)